MKKIAITFRTGINIILNCVDYEFDENTDNHKFIINSDEVLSVKEAPEKNNITGVLID